MAESEEELKNLLTRLKEESEKSGLKLNIKETKIMANRRGEVGNSDSRQPCRTPFSVLNQAVFPQKVLTVTS